MSLEPPERLEFDQEALEAILIAVKPALTSSQYKILENSIEMLIWFQIAIKKKSLSIARLTRIFFGKNTESLKNQAEIKASSDENSPCETKG